MLKVNRVAPLEWDTFASETKQHSLLGCTFQTTSMQSLRFSILLNFPLTTHLRPLDLKYLQKSGS